VKFAERWMRQVRLGRIAQLELVEMPQCKMQVAEFGGELGLIYERAGEMQLIAFSDLVPIHQHSALADARAAPAPRTEKPPEIRRGRTPAIVPRRPLGRGMKRRQHRQGMQDGNIAQAAGPLKDADGTAILQHVEELLKQGECGTI